MHTIEGNDIGTVWIQSIRFVLLYGTSISDDKGSIRELSPLYIHMHHPSENDPVIVQFGDKEILSFIQRNFTDQAPIPAWGYSYAQRLFGGDSRNPVTRIIELLQQYPTAKSATLSLLRPTEDTKHTPCLTTLDFKIRHNTLCLHAFFRSQDIGKKMYADGLQLLRLGQQMNKELQLENVSLFLTVCSAHIYEMDIFRMEQVLKHFP